MRCDRGLTEGLQELKLRSKRADVGPEKANLRLERAESGPEKPWRTDLMYERANLRLRWLI